MKFAAIDVGSNAVRLLLSRLIEDGNQPVFKKEAYISVMKWAKIQKIYLPELGLADGLVGILYENHRARN